MQHIVPSTIAPEYERPKVALSCLQCQRRKRKCDKNSPCQACTQAGIACTAISRARLPRGRRAAQKGGGDLRQRVARLEELLSSKRVEEPTEPEAPCDDIARKTTPVSDTSWTSISEEIIGIRDLVDSLAGDESYDPPVETSETTGTDQIQRFDVLLYGDASCFVQPYVFESPPDAIVSKLVDVYLHRVDPIFKVTHIPSLRKTLLGANTLSSPQEALKFAVLFTAVNTLDEEECSYQLNLNKEAFSDRLQLATEVLLSRNGLLTTPDLTVLQAFVIYLAGLRARKGCRPICILLANAVRIGQCLGLDIEKTSHTPFETEMRRRIWTSIGILDLQATFDIGSYSALVGGSSFRAPPLHINDADISPDDLTFPCARDTFTEMTFSSATHDMLRYMRRMIHVPLDADGTPLTQPNWAQRHAIVEECAQVLAEKYVRICDPAETFQLFTKIVCDAMIVTLRLLVRRPMYRLYSTNPPPDDDFNVLEVATEVLKQTLRKGDNAKFKSWEWFSWVKWYALAVLLAELCEHTEGPLVDQAWIIADASFPRIKNVILDDVLLGSMEKLMRKAQAARKAKVKPAATVYAPVTPISNNYSSPGFEIPGTTIANQEDHSSDFNFCNDPNHQQGNGWEGMEDLSWTNWEWFVQDLGDPVQLDSFNGFG